MLRSLHIENYVLIDSLDVSFPEGLIIITGQTGAGKSILLGALSLLGGARADAASISRGAASCVVEAEFEIDGDHEVRSVLEENGCEWNDGHLIVRRVLFSSGRTRAFVNDSPVSTAVLSSVASGLFDIHSQHQSLLLTDRRYQLSLLDHFCGNGELLSESSKIWNELRECRTQLHEELNLRERLDADREYNAAQLHQLEAASISDPDELDELEAEQKALANSEEIKEYFGRALCLFTPGDTPGIDAALKDVSRILERLAAYLPSLSGLSTRLESARIELSDIREEIESADASVNCSTDRLSDIEDRLSLLYSLMKRHGCTNLRELMEVRDRFSDMLGGAASSDDRIIELKERLSKLESRYSCLCSELRRIRVGAAPAFASEISASLRFLELERSAFVVDVIPAGSGPYGADDVMFRFSSSGKEPVDVAKCASGGEISRIMLCLKAMMSRYAGMPTLVFDEIDTGVSGSVADRMGAMICEMGKNMQVISITHLPQVAAKGDAHYVVSKSFNSNGDAVSGMVRVMGEGRINEIARLLSGTELTPEAVANAKALLG